MTERTLPEQVRRIIEYARAAYEPRERKYSVWDELIAAVDAALRAERERALEVVRRAAGRAAAVSPSAVRLLNEVVEMLSARQADGGECAGGHKTYDEAFRCPKHGEVADGD